MSTLHAKTLAIIPSSDTKLCSHNSIRSSERWIYIGNKLSVGRSSSSWIFLHEWRSYIILFLVQLIQSFCFTDDLSSIADLHAVNHISITFDEFQREKTSLIRFVCWNKWETFLSFCRIDWSNYHSANNILFEWTMKPNARNNMGASWCYVINLTANRVEYI